ncbi:hypothetical protein HDU97_004828 [Phlyctochytrium planicorne]|nr:hypothetical protein HDU97_004828 [Phlyctochytrium planicorne]
MVRSRSIWLSLLIWVALIAAHASALYPDQAGKFDWHMKLAGRPRNVAIQRNDKRTHMYVATDKNAIAFLSPKTGGVDVVSVAVSDKSHVRRWDATTGYVLWDLELPKSSTSEAAVAFIGLSGSQKDVITLVGSTLVRIGGSSGKKLWSTNIGSVKGTLKIAVADKTVYILSASDKDELHVFYYNVDDGKLESSNAAGTGKDAFFLADASIVFTAADGVKDVFGSSTPLVASPLSASTAEFALSSGVNSGFFSVKFDGKKPKLNSIFKFKASEISETSKFTLCLDNVEKIGARLRFGPGATEGLLELVTLSNGKGFAPVKIPLNPRFGAVENIFLESAFKGDEVPGYRLFATTESGTLQGLKESEVLWTRYESLTDSVGSVFVDLPESRLLSLDHDELDEPASKSEALSPVARYIKRWTTHIGQLQGLFSSAPALVDGLSSLPNTLFAPSRNTTKSKEVILQRDKYGFRKLLIFAGSSGNIVAVETEHGNVAWSTYLPGIKVREIIHTRSAVVRFPPIVVLVVENEKDTQFIYLNALTGNFADEQEKYGSFRVPGTPAQVIKLPVQEEADGFFPLAVVDKNLKITIVPNTPSAHAAFKTVIPKFYFYLSEGIGSDSIQGYIVSELKEGVYVSKPVWEVKFGSNEKLAAIGVKNAQEKIASMGRVLGNRQVLYKYLNPNVLAVATLRETSKTTNLYFYLIDTVTGSIFHRSSFPGAGHVSKDVQSVYLAQTEHSFILSFYNHGPDAAELIVEPEEEIPEVEEAVSADAGDGKEKKKKKKKRKAAKKVAMTAPDVKGHEMVVFEIFESIKPNTRMTSSEYSSFSGQRPQVQSQSYVFPIPITALSFTDTKAGITSRELIVGLANNQVYGVSKRLLDSRRPMGAPTADDREEMLVPYRPILDYNPKEVISYHLEVAGVSKIVSSPSEIESTSLVAAYGLDVFLSRRSPSKVFDVLSEDFNYASLILTVIALLIGIQVAKYFAARKRLGDQWL